MKSISPKARFRQLVIKYSQKRGVTAASIRYRVCRKAMIGKNVMTEAGRA